MEVKDPLDGHTELIDSIAFRRQKLLEFESRSKARKAHYRVRDNLPLLVNRPQERVLISVCLRGEFYRPSYNL